ncbi:RagB/SusD family nutrient uptake outer membrane protein [Flavobacterium sp. XS2P39]|uniref:RagB/SusD family nutrient uptake outer membrane protein n=1 Tax=Flavobacterium sp. XS2P39 TaxID=3401725 RepID=UPI003AAAA3A4
MKKLNNKYKIALLSLVLSFTGCTNLDETVYSNVTAEGTVLTSADLSNILAPPFAQLRDVYWGWNGLFDVYEESSDLIVTPFRNGIGWGDLYITMHQHTWGPTLEHAEGLWYQCFVGINYVNRAIFQIENLKNVENPEVYINELRALRAMYYYILYDNFRNVPIDTDFVHPVGFLPKQNTSQEVYDFIQKELTETIPSLKEDNSRATYGRVTKWAAKMTLAKLYLNSGVYLGTPKWMEALKEVDDVINSGKFSLNTNYSDAFAIENENNGEEIFTIPFDNKRAGGSYYPYKTLNGYSQATFNLEGSPWGGSGGIPQFIDTYDTSDSRLKDSWLGGLQYTKSGAPIIMENGKQFEYINYMSEVNGTEYNEGYRMVKYEIGEKNISNTSNDVPFYRFADALMIKAECLLRTGNAGEAASIVSQVRARNFKSNPAKAVVTAATLIGGSTYKYGEYSFGTITKLEGGSDIQYGGFLDELAWEFVGEHHRKQDLIRFGVYTKKSWFSHKPNGDFRSVFPIPQSQMDANHNLVQNPGY